MLSTADEWPEGEARTRGQEERPRTSHIEVVKGRSSFKNLHFVFDGRFVFDAKSKNGIRYCMTSARDRP